MPAAGVETAVWSEGAPWDLYVPLEEVDALHRRQRSTELLREVCRFAKPSATLLRRLRRRALVLFRPVATPNFETLRFLDLAKGSGRTPVLLELSQDWFTPAVNPAKRRLGKLTVSARGDGVPGRKRAITVTSFNETGQRRFQDLRCNDGTAFVAFHHELLRLAAGREALDAIVDANSFVSGDEPRQHYERAFALYSCVGTLADSFAFSGPEAGFTETVVLPAFEAILSRFGVRPAIVELLPEGGVHDPEWDAYPPVVLPLARRAAKR